MTTKSPTTCGAAVRSNWLGRVLVACEYSGIVRDAFAARGWDALSCDLLPTDAPGKHHTGDVRELLAQQWDILIAFPPCTYLCSSGMHWTVRGKRDPQLTEDALDFVRLLMGANAPHIALENPVGAISTRIRKPDCIIHPWQFGHPESKTTCLWLKNLPPLKPTNVLAKPESGRWENQCASGQNKLAPSPDRWKKRSKTYQGIAEAMAKQFSDWVLTMRASSHTVGAYEKSYTESSGGSLRSAGQKRKSSIRQERAATAGNGESGWLWNLPGQDLCGVAETGANG